MLIKIYRPTDSMFINKKKLGIKSSLREHPTHMLVGETRDKETIRALVEC